MRRFELVRGLTRRYWHVSVEGSHVTVTTQVAGMPAQPLTATFASPEAALAEQERLVKERLSWGYVELEPEAAPFEPPEPELPVTAAPEAPAAEAAPAEVQAPAPEAAPEKAPRAPRAPRAPGAPRPRRSGPPKRLLALPPQALAVAVGGPGNRRTRRDAMMALSAQTAPETPRWVASFLLEADAVIRAAAEEYFARNPSLLDAAAAGDSPPVPAEAAARLRQLRAELAPPAQEASPGDLPPGLAEGARAAEAGTFWSAAALPRPKLMGTSAAVPLDAVRALVDLVRSAPDSRASFIRWRQACVPSSLEAFALGLTRAFLAAGGTAEGAWAMRALVAFGADRACQRLADLAAHFNEDGAKDRARAAVAALGELGSDAALVALHGLEARLGRGALAGETRLALADAARRRGMDPESLSDRLVDALGLSPDGTRVLGASPQAPRAALDGALHLSLQDAQGKPLSRFPKGEDPGAEEAWVALRAAAPRVVSEQVRRLELAMSSRRRWTRDDFLAGIAAHPVLRAIARGLVWMTGDPARPALFSLDASGAPVDVKGAEVRLPEGGSVWLAHPLQMDGQPTAEWQAALAAAGRPQPFRQLDRPVFQLAPEEARARSTARYTGRTVTSSRLANLARRGWKLGPSEGGSEGIRSLRKAVGGSVAQLFISPGLPGRTLVGAPPQVLGEVSWAEAGPLGPVEASELLLDLGTLDGGGDAASSGGGGGRAV